MQAYICSVVYIYDTYCRNSRRRQIKACQSPYKEHMYYMQAPIRIWVDFTMSTSIRPFGLSFPLNADGWRNCERKLKYNETTSNGWTEINIKNFPGPAEDSSTLVSKFQGRYLHWEKLQLQHKVIRDRLDIKKQLRTL